LAPFSLQTGVAAFLCGVLAAYKCRNSVVLPVPSASSSEAGGESLRIQTGYFSTVCLVNHDRDPTIVALIPHGDGIVSGHILAFVNSRQSATGAKDATSRVTHRPHQRHNYWRPYGPPGLLSYRLLVIGQKGNIRKDKYRK